MTAPSPIMHKSTMAPASMADRRHRADRETSAPVVDDDVATNRCRSDHHGSGADIRALSDNDWPYQSGVGGNIGAGLNQCFTAPAGTPKEQICLTRVPPSPSR